MDLSRAREITRDNSTDDPGSFYGDARGLSLGMGLIIDKVEYPFFNHEEDRFSIRSGAVYVLSHECDLEPTNNRFLNGSALVCPVLPIEAVLEEASNSEISDNDLGAFLGAVASRKIARCVYLPPLSPNWNYGALVNLNLIVSTSVSRLEKGARIAAISGPALYSIHNALSEHLMRAKSESLPHESGPWSRSRTIAR